MVSYINVLYGNTLRVKGNMYCWFYWKCCACTVIVNQNAFGKQRKFSVWETLVLDLRGKHINNVKRMCESACLWEVLRVHGNSTHCGKGRTATFTVVERTGMLASMEVWHHYFIKRKQTIVCIETSSTMLHSSLVVGSAISYAPSLSSECC